MFLAVSSRSFNKNHCSNVDVLAFDVSCTSSAVGSNITDCSPGRWMCSRIIGGYSLWRGKPKKRQTASEQLNNRPFKWASISFSSIDALSGGFRTARGDEFVCLLCYKIATNNRTVLIPASTNEGMLKVIVQGFVHVFEWLYTWCALNVYVAAIF